MLSVCYTWVGGYVFWIRAELIKICWRQQGTGSTGRTIVGSLKLKIYNLGETIVENFMKLSKIGFSRWCLRGDVLRFSSATVKILIFICCGLAFSFKYFRVQRFVVRELKSFGKSQRNFSTASLVKIIEFCFICGKRKLCWNVKKSLSRIVWKFSFFRLLLWAPKMIRFS